MDRRGKITRALMAIVAVVFAVGVFAVNPGSLVAPSSGATAGVEATRQSDGGGDVASQAQEGAASSDGVGSAAAAAGAQGAQGAQADGAALVEATELPEVAVVVGADGACRASHQVIVSLACDEPADAVRLVRDAGVDCAAAERIAQGLFGDETQFLLTYFGDTSAEAVGAILREAGAASHAEPNYVATLTGDVAGEGPKGLDEGVLEDAAGSGSSVLEASALAATGIDDPLASSQWQLDATNASQAWEVVKTEGAVTVVVVDSGVDTDHSDLVGNLALEHAKNTTNDTYGAAAVEDSHGHGTSVAGIIAATPNNGIGVAGISYNARIIPMKVVDDKGTIYNSYLIKALQEVAELKESAEDDVARNIRVVNMSLESSSASDAYRRAVERVQGDGVLVVAASGNNGSNVKKYPAALDGVVGVSSLAKDATTGALVLASSSNYGSHIAVSAPGASVYSTKKGDAYGFVSGTSFASPMVAGAAALLFAADLEATPESVTAALEMTATDLGDPGRDIKFGYGVINVGLAAKAMKVLQVVPATCTTDGGYVAVVDGETYALTVAALGHDWSSWETVVEPTEASNAVRERVCLRCGEAERHTCELGEVESRVVREATCETDGSRDVVAYCAICGEGTVTSSEVVPATGHSFVDGTCSCGATLTVLPYNGLGLWLVRFCAPTSSVGEGTAIFDGAPLWWDEGNSCWSIVVEGEPVLAQGVFVRDVLGTRVDLFPAGYVRGDVNGNGRVNIVDAQFAYDLACGRHSANEYGREMLWADVSGDGALDAADAFTLQRALHVGWDTDQNRQVA